MPSCSTNLSHPPPSLLAAAQGLSIALEQDLSMASGLILWQASARPYATMGEAQAASLSEKVRAGASLLLTLEENCGTAPLLLGSILPTTGWGTQIRLSPYTRREPLRVAQVDASFFPDGLGDLTVPFCLDIRPTPAVARGQSCYERYNINHPVLKKRIPAGTDYWSRSLLNREWMVRARCADLAQMPLVVTGKYGAGKVAMVGTWVEGVGASDRATAFWTALLRWLLVKDTGRSVNTVRPRLAVNLHRDAAQVTLSNPSALPLPLVVVMRTLSATGAVLADGVGEANQQVLLAPQASSTISFPLPTPSPLADDSIRADTELQVRIGVLSGDGEQILAEQRLFTPPEPLQLRVETENLYSTPYPFHAPGPEALEGFRSRMGLRVGAYTYAPGQRLRGVATVANGLTNLAPHCLVRDLTTPDNASVMALHDGAAVSRKGLSPDGIEAYSMWTGKAGVENAIAFTLPQDATVAEVILVGSYGPLFNGEDHNPGQLVVEADGEPVASLLTLDDAFTAGFGQARLSFTPRPARVLTVRLPWISKHPRARQAAWLGEIEVFGWCGDPLPLVSGQLVVSLVDALTGERQTLASSQQSVHSCSRQQITFETSLPNFQGFRFYRLEASFQQCAASAPLLVLTPTRPLLPVSDLAPANSPGIGLNVSRGFRETSFLGTGTQEQLPGWAMPDDLIWAYSRNLKRISSRDRTEGSRLYVTDTDMRHYVSPWRSFLNGELFFPSTAPQIVKDIQKDQRWSNSDVVLLRFADAWDTGPDLSTLHGWQDFVEFDRWLRASGSPGLQGRTRSVIAAEIHAQHENEWHAWQLDRYVQSVTSWRDAFRAAGKTLVISAQGIPMVAGRPGEALATTLRGMNDDCTWAMLDESSALTTGRQMSELAFNPAWAMSTLVAWGHNSPIVSNWQWHSPVGTPEPSRRNLGNRAWRATVRMNGACGSLYTYGFASNVGTSYLMTERDYSQWWQFQERHALITPETPVGLGLVIGTDSCSDPRHLRFDSADPLTLGQARLLAQAFRLLHDAGVSVPLAANAAALVSWAPSCPLLVLNPEELSTSELGTLQGVHARGARITAIATASALSKEAAQLFSQPGNSIIDGPLFDMTREQVQTVAASLATLSAQPIFPQGTGGYCFRSQETTFIVVEDWLEQARSVSVRVPRTVGRTKAYACNLNDNASLMVSREDDFWSIRLPLKSADGAMVALREL